MSTVLFWYAYNVIGSAFATCIYAKYRKINPITISAFNETNTDVNLSTVIVYVITFEMNVEAMVIVSCTCRLLYI